MPSQLETAVVPNKGVIMVSNHLPSRPLVLPHGRFTKHDPNKNNLKWPRIRIHIPILDHMICFNLAGCCLYWLLGGASHLVLANGLYLQSYMGYLQLIPVIYVYMVYIWYGLKKKLLNLDAHLYYSTFVFCPYGARVFPPTIIIRTGWRPRLVPFQVTEKVDADRSETIVINVYTMMRILMVYILMVIESAVHGYSWLLEVINGALWLWMSHVP